MHQSIENFLANVNALHQIEPKNLPEELLHVIVKMEPQELFKTCSQLATLLHNVPSKEKPITLNEEEIAFYAQEYLKGIVKRLKGE